MILGPYKEPLKEVKSGYGYYGALTFDTSGKLQCHICGGTYDELGMHVRIHDLNQKSYKEKFKLSPTTALISEDAREDRKRRCFALNASRTRESRRELMRKREAAFKRWYAAEGKDRLAQKRLSLESLNKRGICPDQLIELVQRAAKELGNTPTQDQFRGFYKSPRYDKPIFRTFGSWNGALKAAGLKSRARFSPKGIKQKRYTEDTLLDLLRGFYEENNIIPSASDCRRGFLPNYSAFTRVFGSFPEARRRAGLPQITQGQSQKKPIQIGFGITK